MTLAEKLRAFLALDIAAIAFCLWAEFYWRPKK